MDGKTSVVLGKVLVPSWPSSSGFGQMRLMSVVVVVVRRTGVFSGQ